MYELLFTKKYQLPEIQSGIHMKKPRKNTCIRFSLSIFAKQKR